MSFMAKIKKKVGYQTNVPRCEICSHFKKSKIVLTENSNTKRVNHYCLNHGFSIAVNSVCNTWETVSGETLKP
jgi:hypothetical protein